MFNKSQMVFSTVLLVLVLKYYNIDTISTIIKAIYGCLIKHHIKQHNLNYFDG
jgi:hypothetical protein